MMQQSAAEQCLPTERISHRLTVAAPRTHEDLAAWDIAIPRARIAQRPATPRDAARLMVLTSPAGIVTHARFRDLPHFLRPGDVLVRNVTAVRPLRIPLRRPSGAPGEVLLLRRCTTSAVEYEALARPRRALRPGITVRCRYGIRATIVAQTATGVRVRFAVDPVQWRLVLAAIGETPLPPYITARGTDPARYQTVYARTGASAAAPTAGLHFTPRLLATVAAMGVQIVDLTLTVGLGTFAPLRDAHLQQGRLHRETFTIPAATADAIAAARREGRRVIAVGTTTLRALEAAARTTGTVQAMTGATTLFLRPGDRFHVVDGLITNFHVPRSSLLLLVAAFAAPVDVRAAYARAVARGYRFFSFGDAMLVLRDTPAASV